MAKRPSIRRKARKFKSVRKMLAAVERDLNSDDSEDSAAYKVRSSRRKRRPPSLIKMFEAILFRPDMYTGEPTVSSIYNFMDGYCIARGEVFLHVTPPFVRFFKSLWDRFGHSRNENMHWVKILKFHSADEAGALELLRRLWCEHRRGKRQYLPELHSQFGAGTTK